MQQAVRWALVLFGLGIAGQSWAVNITVSGTLPRVLGTTFSFTVSVTGVTAQQAATASADTTTTDQLQIFLTQSIGGTNTPAAIGSGNVTTAMPYYVTIQSTSPATGTPDGQNFDFNYNVTMTYVAGSDSGSSTTGSNPNSPTTLAAKNSPGGIQVGASFFLGGPPTSSTQLATTVSTPFTLVQSNYVATQVPAFSGTAPVVGSMDQITVSWIPQNPITVSGTTGTATPNNVVIIVVDGDLGSQTFPAFEYNPSTTGTTTTSADISSTCNYTQPTAVSSTCIACTNNDTTTGHTNQYYLDQSSLESGSVAGVSVYSSPYSAGSYTIPNLTNGHPYVVFLEYDTPSLTPSSGQQCLIGIPSPNFTLTELNGDPTGTVVPLRCFIATAAYGSPFAKELRYFRKFRDRVLMHSTAGRTFVHYYYKWSPPLANFIDQHPFLRKLTRGVLYVPKTLLETADSWY